MISATSRFLDSQHLMMLMNAHIPLFQTFAIFSPPSAGHPTAIPFEYAGALLLVEI
jgi:hypothetical protein